MADETEVKTAQDDLQKAQEKYDKTHEQLVKDQEYVTECKIALMKADPTFTG